MTESILFERTEDHIGILTLNAPESRNALTLAAMSQFAEHLLNLWDDQELRTVIVTGAGTDAFCAGGDLHDLHPLARSGDGVRVASVMGDALMLLERLPVPVIAAMNGYAVGGGSEIALACDMRIVDERVRFGLVHRKLGLVPGWGGGQRLARLVGYSRAMQMLLSAEVFDAEAMTRLDLANRIAPPGQALEDALAFARSFADCPTHVIRATKATLQAGQRHSYEKALSLERGQFTSLWGTEAHLKAVRAFLEGK